MGIELTILLIGFILLGFILMSSGAIEQHIAMPIVALVAVILAGNDEGGIALHNGFKEFALVALLFTAVAVPAHILQRSRALELVGYKTGEFIVFLERQTNLPGVIFLPPVAFLLVAIMAALFHNTTSILVSVPILFTICQGYGVSLRPILAGALIASNLGGFTTRWGDTPNIIEARVWGLTHGDFVTEILLRNIGSLIILTAVVFIWLDIIRRKRKSKEKISGRKKQKTGGGLFKQLRRYQWGLAGEAVDVDFRLVALGLGGLVIAIVFPIIFPGTEIVFSALAIILCTVLSPKEKRHSAFFALGIETYATLVAIFVLAQVVADSSIGIGKYFEQFLQFSNTSVWSITISSYLGTLFTEAASWASAAAPLIYSHDPSHTAAWALGSGIFAGSSSLVTAASAGIILVQQTKDFEPGDRITFGSYVVFGLVTSLILLGYYNLVLLI